MLICCPVLASQFVFEFGSCVRTGEFCNPIYLVKYSH